MLKQSLFALPRHVRGACLLAASMVTFGILGTLVSTWHQQADPVWLTATPAVLAEVAACDQARDRSQRTQCKRALVHARAHQQPDALLAAR